MRIIYLDENGEPNGADDFYTLKDAKNDCAERGIHQFRTLTGQRRSGRTITWWRTYHRKGSRWYQTDEHKYVGPNEFLHIKGGWAY